jgi:hypothetical protein
MKRFKKKAFWVLYVAVFLAGASIIVALGPQNQSNGIPDVNAQALSGFGNVASAPTGFSFAGDIIFQAAIFPGDIIRDDSGGMRTIMTCSGCSQTISTCEWQCGPTFSQCGTRSGQGSTLGICTGAGISTISTCSSGLFGSCGGGTTLTCGSSFGCGGSTTLTCGGSLFGCGGGTTLTCSGSLFGCGGGTTLTCGSSFGCGGTTLTCSGSFGCGSGTTLTCGSSLFGCGGSTTLTCGGSLFGCGGGTMSTCGSSLFGCGGGTTLTCSGSLFGCGGGTMYICDGNTRDKCPVIYLDTCAPGGGCFCDGGAYLRTRNLTQSPAY